MRKGKTSSVAWASRPWKGKGKGKGERENAKGENVKCSMGIPPMEGEREMRKGKTSRITWAGRPCYLCLSPFAFAAYHPSESWI